MQTMGIRELKARLSQVLREVQAGEVVLVTDRGRVVAELRAPGSDTADSAVARVWRGLASTGALRVGEPHDPDVYAASPVRAAAGTARTLLDETRQDR